MLLPPAPNLFERTTRQFTKPTFGLKSTRIGTENVAVEEETVLKKPFCNLVHFKRDTQTSDPKVLIVAPISGHHSTLLRGTVEAMLPDHDVYITDWIDAKLVPLAAGKFDLEDNITYIMDMVRFLGPKHPFAGGMPTGRSRTLRYRITRRYGPMRVSHAA